MSVEENENDDPAFRGAIRRAMSGERAPAALRQRVEAMLASQRPATPVTQTSRWRLQFRPINWQLTGAAAAVLLSVGFMSYQIRETFFPSFLSFSHGASRAPRVSQFPLAFAMAMVKTHDHCAKLSDHHLMPGDNFDALRVQLTSAEGVDVFAAKIGDDWKFKGAGVCDIDSARAAHLIFTRGDRTVSIFSLPAPSTCSGGAAEFQQSVGNHAIRGFRNGNALYVIVASSPANAVGCEELNARASEAAAVVQKCMAPNTCGSPCGATGASPAK
jgi:hypothetical protein